MKRTFLYRKKLFYFIFEQVFYVWKKIIFKKDIFQEESQRYTTITTTEPQEKKNKVLGR